MSALEAGKIKAVAVTSAKRFPRLPDVPTFAESGLPRFESNGSFGIVVPAGTPADVIAKLNGAFVKVLNDPEIAARIRELGGEPMPMTPDAVCRIHQDGDREVAQGRGREPLNQTDARTSLVGVDLTSRRRLGGEIDCNIIVLTRPSGLPDRPARPHDGFPQPPPVAFKYG